MQERKIYPSKINLFKNYIIVDLIFVVIFCLVFSSRFAYFYGDKEKFNSYITQDVIVVLIAAALSILGWFLLTKNNYYRVQNSCIIHHRFTKEYRYDFDQILYIDLEYSKTKDSIRFFTNYGKEIFLINDKDRVLLATLEKNCKKLINKDLYMHRFPKAKI